MNTERPFSGPAAVSLAGLALVTLATASFTSGLLRQLRVPAPDNSATVIVIPQTEAPPPIPAELLAFYAEPPKPAQPVRREKARRRPAPPPMIEAPPAAAEPAPATMEPPPSAPAAPDTAIDAAETLAASPPAAEFIVPPGLPLESEAEPLP